MSTVVEVWRFDESLSTPQMLERVGVSETAAHFLNATNTDGCSLLAQSTVPMGIDVESLRFHPYLDRLARRSMLDEEHAAWMLTADRNASFTQHWTRVEAYLKATGEGIRGGLLTRAPADWTVVELDVGAHHCAAIAVASPELTLKYTAFSSVDEPPVVRKFAGSALGATLAAGMIGLANVLEPRKKDEAPIIVNHDGGDGDGKFALDLDPEDPKRSKITIRRWKR